MIARPRGWWRPCTVGAICHDASGSVALRPALRRTLRRPSGSGRQRPMGPSSTLRLASGAIRSPLAWCRQM
eukprot:15439383-Alexandrium_andersonii.AAC.1